MENENFQTGYLFGRVTRVFRLLIRVLHGNGNGKIPRDYRGKTAGTVIRTKSITAVTAGTETVRAVIPWERESKKNTKEYRL